MSKSHPICVAGIAAFLALNVAPIQAQDIWNGADGTWSLGTNWLDGSEPTAADAVVFPAVIPAGGSTITLATGESANTLSFLNSYTLSGGSLTLGLGTVSVETGFTASISSILAGTAVEKTGAGTLVLSGNNTFNGALTLTAGTLRATTSAGALGAGTLTLAGGILQLANDTALNFGRATTITGDTQIVSDRLTTGAGLTHTLGTLSIGAQTLTISAGTGVDPATTAGVTFGNTTLTGNATINTGLNALTTFSGTLTMGANGITVGGAGTTVFAGATGPTTASAGTITKEGTGTLRITSDPNNTGLMTINGGVVELNHSGATDHGAVINSGGTLRTLTAAVGDQQTVTVNTGGLYDVRANDTIGRLLGSGTVTNGGAAGATLTVNSATASTFSGVLQNGASVLNFSKSGANTVTLSGTNTYTGNTNVNQGVLQVQGVGARLSGGGVAIVGDNNGNDENLIFGNAAVPDTVAGTLDMIADTGTLRFNGSTNIIYNGPASDSTGTTETMGSLDFAAGTGVLTLNAAAGGTLQLNASSLIRVNNNASGVIRGTNLGGTGPGSTRLLFATAPTVVGGGGTGSSSSILPFLIGSGSATGVADTFLRYDAVNGVTPLSATDYAGVIAGSTGLNVSTGTETLNGDVAVNALRLTGGEVTLGSAATGLIVTSGALLFTGSTTITGPGTLTLGGPGQQATIHSAGNGTALTNTISANLGAGSGLIIGDAGDVAHTVVLAGDNKIRGGIIVNNGILQAGSAGALNDDYFNDLILRAGNSTIVGATATALQLNGNNVAVLFGGDDRLQGSTRIQNASATPATLTVVTNANSASNDGVIENGTGGGALSLIKRGTANLVLEQANTFTGTTEILGGTLQLNTANGRLTTGVIGTIGSSAIIIRSGGVLNLNNTNTANQGDRILNTAGITMHGGTFQFDNNQGTANYSETIDSMTLASGNNTITTDYAATGQTSALTINTLTINAGAAANFQGSNTATEVAIGEGGNRNRVVLTNAPTLTTGGLMGGNVYHTKDFNLATTQDVVNFATYVTGASATVAAFSAYNTGAETGWTAATVANPSASVGLTANRSIEAIRLGGGINVDFGAGQTLNLSAGGLLHNGVNSTISNGTLTAGTSGPAELAIRVEDNLTVSTLEISSVIANNAGGAVSLLKTGADNLTLSGANTYTGRTTLQGGTVTISGDNSLGQAPATPTDGHLRLYGTTLSLASTAGAVTLNANRQIELGGGANTITAPSGTSLIYDGRITSNGASGLTLVGDIDMALSGSSEIGGAFVHTGTTAAGGSVVSLGGTVNNIGEGLTVANSSNSATLNYSVPGGTLTVGLKNPNVSNLDVGSRTAAAASVDNVGILNLSGSDTFIASVDRVRLGVLTVDPNPDAVTRGVVTLATNNRLTAGTEVMISDSPNDSLGGSPSSLTFGAGENILTTPLFTIGGRKGNATVSIAAGGTLNYQGFGAATGDLVVAASTSGTGVTSVGTLNLSEGTLVADLDEIVIGTKSAGAGAGGATGVITLGSGANDVRANSLSLGRSQADAANTASGTLNLAGGTFAVSGNVTVASRTGSAGTGVGILNLTGGTLSVGGNIVTQAASTSATSTINLNGGTLDLTGGTISVDNFNANTGTLSNTAEIYTDDGVTAAALSKSSPGVLTLAGANAYTGTTTVTDGTLLVNGSLSGSVVLVSTGTLGGTGSIAKALTIGDAVGIEDAVVAPGVGIGTLSVQNVSFASDAAFSLEINTNTLATDLFASSGTISLGSGLVALDVADLGATVLGNVGTFTFLTAATGITGTFADLPDGSRFTAGVNTFEIDYGANSVSITAVPEPGAALSLACGVASLLGLRRFRRRQD